MVGEGKATRLAACRNTELNKVAGKTFDKTNALKTLLDNNHAHPCRKINATLNKRRLVQTKIPALLHDLSEPILHLIVQTNSDDDPKTVD